MTDWESYLRARFPGYLLPESAASELSVDEAERFLEGLTGRSDQLDVLRAATLVSSRNAELRAFVGVELPGLVRNLSSCSESVRRQWEGAFHGRLAVPATLALRLAGRGTSFVTQSRRRTFDLPENIVLRTVCARLLAALVLLRKGGALPDTGWGLGLGECEGALRRLLTSTALREVPDRVPTQLDENSARGARHATYHQAARWLSWIRECLDEADPKRIARVVAEGALHPIAEPTRFELAVLTRLAEALEYATVRATAGWSVERALVHAGRSEVFAFVHESGARLRIYYNQAVLPAGDADRGVQHYLRSNGRLRPDITVTVQRTDQPLSAVVFECKHSSDLAYLAQGYREAVLYRWEYARHLAGWPKSVLVASGDVAGVGRVADDVIAVGWRNWPPPEVVQSILQMARLEP